MTATDALDLASVFVFATSGALVASRQQLDPVGFAFVACLTAVGGGTVRDVLLDRNPVFWIAEPINIAAALLAAALAFLIAPQLESRIKVIRWLDAVALSVAVVAGVSAAIEMGASPMIITIMGIVTGTMGGLMRDVVCNDVPLVLRHGELYVTAAFAGSLTSALVAQVIPDPTVYLLAGALACFILRAGSLLFGWALPNYRHKPPQS
ncbi:MAG: trimeric intracellular cation channel family protein [Pseudomonadota bacterium]|nr:trimeric intracellular cation channel family protein [Pseudomonadota bacterium]MEE3070059.1 trimeric intracellular cation channel family protein [Pseudomonadota bacterium]